MTLEKTIESLRSAAYEALAAAATSSDVEKVSQKYLGKKGPLQDLMRSLREVSAEERPALGKAINDLKVDLEGACEARLATFLQSESTLRLEKDWLDVTAPGRKRQHGSPHLVSQMLDEVVTILRGMGFSLQSGPDIETDYYNFGALNFPKDHPARDMQDTFYITEDVVLRTHTSNVQVRVMEHHKPPLRVMAPGRCFRNEDVTARSHVFFHQVEGFYVDESVSFGDLMAFMEAFLARLFGPDTQVRYRPSYFPFVEPGMEVDVRCASCSGCGCSVCKHTGWLEILGAGMIHPEVLRHGGIDPEKWMGFAFGLGIERLVMLRHGIPDIRLFYDNDLRLMEQF